MSETTNTTTADATSAARQIVQDNLTTTYANVFRIAQTPNEVILDFGLDPNLFGPILDEPLRLNQRVVMSQDATKRLCIYLGHIIQAYEAKYGVIELDLSKRLIPEQK